MELKDLLADARASVKSLTSARRTRVSLRLAGRLPDLNGSSAAVSEVVTCLLKEMIKSTPRGAGIVLEARAIRRRLTRGNGGQWVEVVVRSRQARLGERGLHRVLKCAEPIRLADVLTEVYRGEVRLIILCRLLRLKSGWFVIRGGGGSVPSFAVVVRAPKVRR